MTPRLPAWAGSLTHPKLPAWRASRDGAWVGGPTGGHRVVVGKYAKATRAEKADTLDQLCEVNGRHHDHAREALPCRHCEPRRRGRGATPGAGAGAPAGDRELWRGGAS